MQEESFINDDLVEKSLTDEQRSALKDLLHSAREASLRREAEAIKLGLTSSVSQDSELRAILAEQQRRSIESLKLWRPLPGQLDFHRACAWQKLILGSNRSGKTTTAAVDFAWHITGTHPHSDHFKSKDPSVPFRAILVGLREESISEVFYPKLFRSGAFKIIKDQVTQKWRAFNPDDPEDAARAREAKPSLPLIPPRMIKEIAWGNKRKRVFKKVTLTNGAEIVAYTGGSGSEPPQGMDVDIAWFDEEVHNAAFYPEVSARLLDRSGLFLWSATPQHASNELFDLYQQSQLAEKAGDKLVVHCTRILLDDNPHMPEVQRNLLKAKFANDQEAYNVRIKGEFAMASRRVFSTFHISSHRYDVNLSKGVIPRDWTRYAITDPGHRICATLFVATSPPNWSVGQMAVAYDELYIANCNARMYAEAMKEKCDGQDFEAFIIDGHGSAPTSAGSGVTIRQHFTDALSELHVSSHLTGSSFIIGSNNVEARLAKARSWLAIRAHTGLPYFMVWEENCPNLIREFDRYTLKVVNGIVRDEPQDKGKVNNHLMHCFQYAAAHGCSWVPPRHSLSGGSGAYKMWVDVLQMEANMRSVTTKVTSLGPPANPSPAWS